MSNQMGSAGSPCVSAPVKLCAVEAFYNRLLERRQKKKVIFIIEVNRVFWGKPETQSTSMFPHVWKAVNMNMKPKPRTMMFQSFFPSGLMLEEFWWPGSKSKHQSVSQSVSRSGVMKTPGLSLLAYKPVNSGINTWHLNVSHTQKQWTYCKKQKQKTEQLKKLIWAG